MEIIQKFEPLFGDWTAECLIGTGSYGRVYKIRREAFGNTHYAAVKLISIPQNPQELQQLASEGMDHASMRNYF